MRELPLYLKLAFIFVASLVIPTATLAAKVEKILAEIKSGQAT